jgi:site-specific DNA-cytosine methylase
MAKEKLTQLDLFDIMYPPFKFSTDKPIKLFEAFAGIGCQRMALNKLVGKDKVESVGISEIDQFALNSYEAIHGDLKNYGDIAKISGEELENE